MVGMVLEIQQPSHRGGQFLDALFEKLRIIRTGDRIRPIRKLEPPGVRVAGQVGLFPAEPLDLGPQEVPGDGAEPVAQRGAGGELADMPKGIDEDLMRQFIDEMSGRRPQGDERPDMGEVLVHQRFEGVEIAVLYPEDQGVFGDRIKVWPGRLHQSRPHIARGGSNLTNLFRRGGKWGNAGTRARHTGQLQQVFNPRAGHEQAGRRPARMLILSSDKRPHAAMDSVSEVSAPVLEFHEDPGGVLQLHQRSKILVDIVPVHVPRLPDDDPLHIYPVFGARGKSLHHDQIFSCASYQ